MQFTCVSWQFSSVFCSCVCQSSCGSKLNTQQQVAVCSSESVTQSTSLKTTFGYFSWDRRQTKAHFGRWKCFPELTRRRCSAKYGHRKCTDTSLTWTLVGHGAIARRPQRPLRRWGQMHWGELRFFTKRVWVMTQSGRGCERNWGLQPCSCYLNGQIAAFFTPVMMFHKLFFFK